MLTAILLILAVLQPSFGQSYPQNDLNPFFGNSSFRQFIQELYDQNQRQHEEVMAKIENLEQVSRERDRIINKLNERIEELEEEDQGEDPKGS